FDVQQPADAIDPYVNHEHVDATEKHETNKLGERDSKKVLRRAGGERRREDRHDLVNRVATNPGLNSEPAARDERAHQRGNVRTARAERCTAKNREGDSVTR